MALTPKSDGSGATGDESLGIEAFQAVDRIREALSGQLSGGVSPGSLMMAYVDWAFHLAQAPGKQMELGVKARRNRAIVSHHQIGNPRQLEPGFLVVADNRIIGQVARGHHQSQRPCLLAPSQPRR